MEKERKFGFLFMDFGGDATYRSAFRGWALILFSTRQRDHHTYIWATLFDI